MISFLNRIVFVIRRLLNYWSFWLFSVKFFLESPDLFLEGIIACLLIVNLMRLLISGRSKLHHGVIRERVKQASSSDG